MLYAKRWYVMDCFEELKLIVGIFLNLLPGYLDITFGSYHSLGI